MINFFQTILTSNNPNNLLYKTLLILFLIYVFYLILYKFKQREEKQEVFVQNEKFILKKDENIYDDFYSDIYDKIHLPEERIVYELKKIIKTTEQNTRTSVFLDIGSGTGHMVNELKEAGYTAYGIDKSESMINKSKENYPNTICKEGDVLEPMSFEKSTFTHIICTYFTIYHLKDKRTFFNNCYYWLMPNGYLILHLVNRNKYDTITPAGKLSIKSNTLIPYKNPHEFEKSRITDTIVEFPDFEYKSSYHFDKNKSVTITETFKDNKTNNVRQNENILYMEDINDILNEASNIGFNVKAVFDLKKSIDDENQFIYILERIG